MYLAKVQDVTWKREKSKKTKKKLNNDEKIHLSIPIIIAIGKGVLYRVLFVFGVVILGIKGLDDIPAAMVITAFMASRTIATLIGGFISDLIGEKRTLILFNTLALIAVCMLIYGNLVISIIGIVIIGFTINATSAANITLTHKIMPNNINYGTGLIMGFSATLSAVAMLGYGVIVDQVGHLDSLYILLVAATILMILSYLVPNTYNKATGE